MGEMTAKMWATSHDIVLTEEQRKSLNSLLSCTFKAGQRFSRIYKRKEKTKCRRCQSTEDLVSCKLQAYGLFCKSCREKEDLEDNKDD